MKLEIDLAKLYNDPKMRKRLRKEANGWKDAFKQFGSDWAGTGKQVTADFANSATGVASQLIGGRK